MAASTLNHPKAKPRGKAKSNQPAKAVPGTMLVTKSQTGSTLGTHVVRLSDPEMKSTVDEIKRRIREEPGYGRSLLQSAGIVNKKGKLTKAFGG